MHILHGGEFPCEGIPGSRRSSQSLLPDLPYDIRLLGV